MKQKNLLLVASFFYTFAAVQLLYFSISWFPVLSKRQIAVGIGVGLFFGVFKYFAIFNKRNQENVDRILKGDEKQKVIHVFKPSTYILILGMIALGLTLRLVFAVPQLILLPLYFAIGLALLISAFYYFFEFLKLKKNK